MGHHHCWGAWRAEHRGGREITKLEIMTQNMHSFYSQKQPGSLKHYKQHFNLMMERELERRGVNRREISLCVTASAQVLQYLFYFDFNFCKFTKITSRSKPLQLGGFSVRSISCSILIN